MLIGNNQKAFDSLDYIYELKLDGIRCLTYLWENGIELRNKRNKRLNSIYPELKDIYHQAKSKCILDGELVILNGGKPDFFELQRRSLMSNPVKIEFMAKKMPVCFTAFDILYQDNRQITQLPLLERKNILLENILETPNLAVSRYIDTNGVAFFNAVAEQGLEGVIAKRKSSKYYVGKTTKDWVKMKALLDEDFIICGYSKNSKNTASAILGAYKDGKIVYQGHAVLGISRRDFDVMTKSKRVDKNEYPGFPDIVEAIWLHPHLVCKVDYMERTPSGGLRQPIFKGIRDDKTPEECIVYS
jgi:bifunctional non-homologous end joining protein LigD/DNA ligase-1